MPSPEKSCTRCAAGKWRRCARCRSDFTTEASIRRRCSCCWPGFIWNAPATSKPFRICGPRSKRRSAGSPVPGDPDGDGFVEYQRATDQGLANQGWKDSYDAVFHADGRLAEGNIALAEVQGYVYAAKRMAARCARRIGREREAQRLDAEADRLAAQFEAAFWCPEIETYALALDGGKAPCAVRTSNAGQLLFTGIADPARAALVANGLLRPDFFSGWGIRTVARGEARYNPMSYHNGSVWPHDNALIALGLARYGLKQPVETLFTGLFHAGTYMLDRRLPELFCGFRRQEGQGPTLYPVACAPQAWASATPFTLLEACLGLEFDPFRNEIRLFNPHLPPFLDEVMLRNLKLGSSRLDLRVRRHGETVSLDTSADYRRYQGVGGPFLIGRFGPAGRNQNQSPALDVAD